MTDPNHSRNLAARPRASWLLSTTEPLPGMNPVFGSAHATVPGSLARSAGFWSPGRRGLNQPSIIPGFHPFMWLTPHSKPPGRRVVCRGKVVVSPHMCHNLLACAALAVACLLMAGSALANTVTVTTLADPHEDGKTSLREAIPATGINGTINFLAGLTGTIILNGNELEIGRSLTITGPGATSLTISGNGKSRVFNILSNTPALTVTVSGLSIQSGTVTGTNGIAGGH